MKSILVYSDSLSWGIIPPTRKRYSPQFRWPCVMAREINAVITDEESKVTVIEDCLNGRRTMWEDPIKAGRNGLVGLSQKIESHSPLSYVLLMLGTNDFQSMHDISVSQSAQGIASLIEAIRSAAIEPGMQIPEIVVMAPPLIQKPMAAMAKKFNGADLKSRGLATEYRAVAAKHQCYFFDVSSVTNASRMDGVHLDSDQQVKLGKAMAEYFIGIKNKK